MRIDDVLSNACRLQGSLEHEDACPNGYVDSLSPHGPIQRPKNAEGWLTLSINDGFGRPTFGGAAPFNVVDFFPSFETRGKVGFAGHRGHARGGWRLRQYQAA